MVLDHHASYATTLAFRNGVRVGWRAPIPYEQAMQAKVGPKKIAVHVVVNHGRWVVECPDCSDAQMASRDDRRFMCTSCGNAAVDGLWRPVIWPDDPDGIGEALDVREAVHHKNWEPGETVAELHEQNKVLDVPESAEQASDHEGHTHSWPKRVTGDKVYTCRDCGLQIDGALILDDRAAAKA